MNKNDAVVLFIVLIIIVGTIGIFTSYFEEVDIVGQFLNSRIVNKRIVREETVSYDKKPEPPEPAPPPPPPTPVPVPKPEQDSGNRILVAALKIKYTEYSLGDFKRKINTLLRDYPSVDLIVTPEFLFYGWGESTDYTQNPVKIECEAECFVYPTTQKSEEIIEAVEFLKTNARKYKFNIVFGTVAEKDFVEGKEIILNTQLIINREGKIIGKHSKTGEFFSEPRLDCTNNPFCEKVYQLSLDTARTYELSSSERISFTIAPAICGEILDSRYIKKMENSQADLVVVSNFDQDCIWDDETEKIQIGLPAPREQFGCWNEVMQPLINTYTDKNIVKENSHLLVSDGLTGAAGIISLERELVDNLAIRADYVYGEIPMAANKFESRKIEYAELPPEAEYYLQPGKLTNPGPGIKAVKIKPIVLGGIKPGRTGKPWEQNRYEFNIIRGILKYVKDFRVTKTDYDPNSWKLTVNDIFTRGINNNQCGQYGKLFVTLARLYGIPAKYSSAYYEYWADEQKKQGCWDWLDIKGHVYAKVYINGEWYAVDPQSGTFVDLEYRKIIDSNKGNAKAIIIAEGRDNADFMKYLDRWCVEGLRYNAAIPDLPWCPKVIITKDMLKIVTECKQPLKTLEFEQQKKTEQKY